jgi:hypothetical protein
MESRQAKYQQLSARAKAIWDLPPALVIKINGLIINMELYNEIDK